MHVSRRTRILFFALLLGTLWAALFAATHVPMKRPKAQSALEVDKFEHVAAFALLASVLCLAATSMHMGGPRLYAAVVLLLALYGAFDEITQLAVPSRTADVWDWIADMTGATIGVTAFALARRFFSRPRQTVNERATPPD
jgi:VanZ family protein